MTTSSDILRRYPFLRLLVVLVIGIILGNLMFESDGCREFISFFHHYHLYIFTLLGTILVGLYLVSGHHPTRWIYGTLLTITIVLLGATITTLQLKDVRIELPKEKAVYSLRIMDSPIAKGKTLLSHAILINRIDSDRVTPFKPQPQILLYIRKDSTSLGLKMNDEICINSTPYMPATNSTISRYSYRDYLYRRGISAICYADSLDWHLYGHCTDITARQRADICRDSLMCHYRRLGFDGDNLAVLSAITLGYRENLDKELQESYSIAGVSHVLAISGMHIGFICAILLLLMRIVPGKSRIVVFLKNAIAIAALWYYVFLIGLPISAVRASAMFSLYLLIMVFRNEERASINILLLTATIMLAVRPLWLFDIGFQLSFISVASILIFLPLMKQIWNPRNTIVRYVWGVFAVTIVAQLGTAPLTMLYFYRQPLYFLFANPIVILLLTVIVYSVIAMAALCFIPVVQLYAASTIDELLTLLNTFVRWLSSLPHSSIDNIYIRPYECLLLYLIPVAAALFVVRHSARRLLLLSLSVILFIACRTQFLITTHPSDSIYLYSCNGAPIVHCTSRSGESWVVSDTTVNIRTANFSAFCAAHRLRAPHIVKSDYKGKSLATSRQIVVYKGYKIVLLTDNRWQRMKSERPLRVDCIYVGRSFKGDISKTLELFKPRTIVADKQTTERRDRELHDKCREKGVACNTISEEGSISIML